MIGFLFSKNKNKNKKDASCFCSLEEAEKEDIYYSKCPL